MTKKKSVIKTNQITPEQLLQQEFERCMETIHLIPEPTYYFNVGDIVEVGALKDVYISKIFENGKLYEIEYIKVDNNYGNPIITKGAKRIVNWLDVRKPNDNNSSFIKNKDLQIKFHQTSVECLFQRKYFY